MTASADEAAALPDIYAHGFDTRYVCHVRKRRPSLLNAR